MNNFKYPDGYTLRRVLHEANGVDFYVFLPTTSDIDTDKCSAIKVTTSEAEDKIEYPEKELLLSEVRTATYR